MDTTGQVTGIKEGSANITADATNSAGTSTTPEACMVTVTAGYDVSVTDNKATITKYYGDNKAVVIPDTIDVNGVPVEVVAIGDNAFSKNQDEINNGDKGITAVTIPATVTSMGAMAFNNCQNLTKVTFDSGSQLTTVGNSCFMECNTLNNIVLPDTVTAIGDYAFGSCSALQTLALPDSLTTIGINSFYFTGLTAITIPGQVTSIPTSAFYGCKSLATIDLPAGLQTIGGTAFAFAESQTPIARTFIFNGNAPSSISSDAIPATSGSGTVVTTIKYKTGSTGFDASAWPGYTLAAN